MTERPKTGSIAIEEHLAIVAFYKKVIVHLNRKIHSRMDDENIPASAEPLTASQPVASVAADNIIVIDFRRK